MKKGIIGIIICSILLIGATGCVDTSEPSGSNINNDSKKENKTEFNQNETVTYKNVAYTITNVEHSNGTEWNKPAEGKEFVIVTIKIENKSKSKISYNGFDWKMQNSSGQEDSETFTTINNDTNLSSGDLISGGVKEGTIAFEQPIDDDSLKLNYYDNLLSKDYSFQIKLNN